MKNADAEKQKVIFSANLKRYMEQSGEKTADLSNALGYPFSTVSDWVKGKKYPRMDKVQVLADHFGILKSDLTEKKPTPVSESGAFAPYQKELLDLVNDMDDDTIQSVLDIIKQVKKLKGE